MKASSIIGGITLIAVLALIGTACWQAAGRQESAANQQVERDLFGAPLATANQPAVDPQLPDGATADPPILPSDAASPPGAPAEEETTAPLQAGAEALPQQFDPQPAEPFEMPEIMAYA
jgi:hypothetical protein